MTTRHLPRTAEYSGVDAARFREEILPAGQPAILRGLVADWPAVAAGRTSDAAMADYLRGLDAGKPVTVLQGDPGIGGRFFYRDDMSALNFTRSKASLSATLDAMLAGAGQDSPPALAVQSTPTSTALPDFVQANPMPLVDARTIPRVWIGGRIVTATHFDLNYNIACAVAGRRRFTLFPPDQLANLYVGPFEFTPAGPPVSMVDLARPDLDRYPRFEQALAAAQVAELEPGDAIYIPYFWFHNVESLDPFNVLVNYWWAEAQAPLGTPLEALLYALVTLRDLPHQERAIWRGVFDHYVFQTGGDPVAHIPRDKQGSLGQATPEHLARVRAILLRVLGAA